jgi:hypothetical protein
MKDRSGASASIASAFDEAEQFRLRGWGDGNKSVRRPGMHIMTNTSMDRALKLAAVTGLRLALGPAIVARARYRPERHALALAALGEMVFDKLPFAGGRDALPSLIARGVAGAWVAGEVAEGETGVRDPWAAPLGAAVAMGVAVAAPKVRRTLGWTTGLSQVFLGAVEDYFALRVGTAAAGMSMNELPEAARESVDDLRERMGWEPTVQRTLFESASTQSTGAGSM